MPTKSHHRSRSSVDRVFDLLADLQDTQISLLLDDFNHTTDSNVPVSKAIALFDPRAEKPTPKHPFARSSSPVRTLQAELERRHSRRIASAPEPITRPKTASPPSTQKPASPLILETPPLPSEPLPSEPLPLEKSDRPSLIISPPETRERANTSSSEQRSGSRGPRSYKRISRPLFLSPTATAELHELLLAYLQDTPTSATTTATPSPVTPKTSHSWAFFSPMEPETDGPGLDLLEPSPTRLPVPIFSSGRMVKQPSMESMHSIFEVLASR